MAMFRTLALAATMVVAALVVPASAAAQDAAPALCGVPDSIVVRGNSRMTDGSIRSAAGLQRGDTLNFVAIRKAIRDLYGTEQFDDVRVSCEIAPDSQRALLIVVVTERMLLGDVAVEGVSKLSERTVKDRVDLLVGRPIDPAAVSKIVQRIDSLYESEGYYLARVTADTTVVSDRAKLTFRIDEGRRLAVSGIEVEGNEKLGADRVVSAMKTRPEGFWWFRRGEFDEDEYAVDLGARIPDIYANEGFIDFQILRDTLIVDRERGKAMVSIVVDEGERYYVGDFEVTGNRRFNAEELQRFFPFEDQAPSLTQRMRGLLGGGDARPEGVFSQAQWDEATQRLNTAYYNEGYIRAQINPVVERTVGPDSVPTVNLRWEIFEGQPAIINKVIIAGNDYTTESCIRDQIFVLPGDVFNYDRLIRSYQNIQNLGFFEAPLPPPDTRPANDKGDVDIIFNVKEKRTGSINFGASMGQGTGVGGFLGLDQPNVFGQCKRVALNWQFGRYINDFQLTYQDPAIRQSRISGTTSLYHTRSRYTIADLGRQTRIGGSLQLGFPVPWSRFTRLYLSYGAERVKAGGGLFERDTSTLFVQNGFRSSLGLTATHDTRIDLPFATEGGLQTVSAQFNGGPLGGDARFSRYTGEFRAYAPLGQFGGQNPGSQPGKFVFGLTARAGAVFGDVGPFLFSQKFALGGTQFGEMLRGYDEFSITPQGYVLGTSNFSARRESFGSAFFTTTAEVGFRLNQSFYTNVFFDAGNIWDRPSEFDPTRLFRGAGVGVALITPLGPLGLDWAYGFDRLNSVGDPDPKWQLHFRLGNIF
jgi:outer membrane protein insertion porin family